MGALTSFHYQIGCIFEYDINLFEIIYFQLCIENWTELFFYVTILNVFLITGILGLVVELVQINCTFRTFSTCTYNLNNFVQAFHLVL